MDLPEFSPLCSEEWLQHSTPSRADGVPFEVEERYRKRNAALIFDVCSHTKLDIFVGCTALYYVHWYYTKQSIKKSDRWAMLVAAIFVAAKAEDKPKSLDKLIQTAWRLRYGACTSSSPQEEAALKNVIDDIDDPTFLNEVTNVVLIAERALLYTLDFMLPTFQVQRMLMRFWQNGNPDVARTGFNLVERMAGSLPQLDCMICWMALTRVLDIACSWMGTSLCLRYTQFELTWAHIVLASRLLEEPKGLYTPDGVPAWRIERFRDHFYFEDFSRIDGIVSEVASMYVPVAMAAKHSVAAPNTDEEGPSSGREITAHASRSQSTSPEHHGGGSGNASGPGRDAMCASPDSASNVVFGAAATSVPPSPSLSPLLTDT